MVIVCRKTNSPLMVFVYLLMVNFIKSFGLHQSKKFFLTYQTVTMVTEFSKDLEQLEGGFKMIDNAESDFNARGPRDLEKEMKKVQNDIEQWLVDFDYLY